VLAGIGKTETSKVCRRSGISASSFLQLASPMGTEHLAGLRFVAKGPLASADSVHQQRVECICRNPGYPARLWLPLNGAVRSHAGLLMAAPMHVCFCYRAC